MVFPRHFSPTGTGIAATSPPFNPSHHIPNMPRVHKRSPGARKYADYTGDTPACAVQAVKKGMTLRAAERKFDISMKTLSNRVRGAHQKRRRGQCVYSEEEE